MIQREDIIRVAKSINKSLSDSEVDAVLYEYSKLEDSDEPWDVLVENIIYSLNA